MSEDSVDTTEVTLPTSGKKVVIRNYTTDADDTAYNRELFDKVVVQSDKSFDIPMLNTLNASKVYVHRLVQSIDGEQSSTEILSNLRSEDFKAIQDVVDKISGTDSPKAKAGDESSKNDTPAK